MNTPSNENARPGVNYMPNESERWQAEAIRLKKENDALKAYSDRLKHACETAISTGSIEVIECILMETPAQALAAVRAEAAQKSFVDGYWWGFSSKEKTLGEAAAEYADKIRNGEV